MARFTTRKFLTLIGVFALVWLGLRWLLPLILPFLLGLGIALAAEPLVSFGTGRLHLGRGLSAGLGVSITLVLLLSLVVLLGAALVRELGVLAGVLPDVQSTITQGLTSLQDLLLRLAGFAPDGIRTLLTQIVLDVFSGGTALVSRISARLPGMLTTLVSGVPDSLLAVGTAVLSAYMLSARLPRLRQWLRQRPLSPRVKGYLASLKGLRKALGGWLKAQAKLSGMTFLITTAGLLVLGIPYAPVWAFLIALVDAVPMLGTGAVLLPWALICLLRREHSLAIGLVGTFAAAALTRSALEPRLVGRQLGLDPLVTLVALYAGYRLWGIGGMLLAPILAVTAMELASARGEAPPP